ncbi:MAG: papain family cysteine protease [Fluviicola sp.]|jgi:hypothetical protein|uniref:C1 family peptidase n=1 Tax=Fluviicola sp. TaxID=1917219 RepID=UPI00260781F2|nr:C1 family peptidase [Fluviicola sp.]MDF3029023.1 papain family cysteine protease [Fluviicola sp.]
MKHKDLIFALVLFITPLSFSQNYGMGGIPMNESDYRSIPLASTAGMGDIPSYKDLSSWFPLPGHQGGQGSCVAWAVGYGLKSYQEAVESRIKPVSSDRIFSPSYLYNQVKISGCAEGAYLWKALDFLKTTGITNLNEFPYDQYDCFRIPGDNLKFSANRNRIADYRTVDFKNAMSVKSQIASNFPVPFLMEVDEGFYKLPYGQVYNIPSGKILGHHAMVVVGYDDNRNAFKVLNSWGTDWSTGGYGWISYSIFAQKVVEAYSVQDIVISNTTEELPLDLPTPPQITNANMTVIMSQPIITHDIWGVSPTGNALGMKINVPGTIFNAQNSQGQLIVRFYMPDGNPLIANIQEFSYRDLYGLCAAGTQALPILNNQAELGAIDLFIPYYALNLIPTNGTRIYDLAAVASFYINNYEKGRSQFTPFQVRF